MTFSSYLIKILLMNNFIPDTSRFPFPEDTSMHYAEVNMDRGIKFDKNYPYVDYSKGFRFKRFWVRVLLNTIVAIMAKVKMGLKIEGKGFLKQYKDILSSGAVSVANHVHYWDYICVMRALHKIRWPYLLSWDKNVNGPSGPLVRFVGGIPIPLHDPEATVAFSNAINKVIKEGNILHIYPEGSMWEYYRPIRPFKIGAASIAIKNDVPIIPLGFSYRKPNWIRRKVFHQLALFTLKIGEPLFPNPDLPRNKQIEDLTIKAHQAVVSLSDLKEDIYEPIYNNSKKINTK